MYIHTYRASAYLERCGMNKTVGKFKEDETHRNSM